jgi:hypothetical protein
MFGKNNCKWVKIGVINKCNKSCMKEYCGIHMNSIYKGHTNRTCTICGIGIKGACGLCIAHGRNVERMKPYNKVTSERRRLLKNIK